MQGPADNLCGQIFSNALPVEDPVLYGHVDLEPKGRFEARSFQTFRLTYTAGRYGIDDTGSIRIVYRFTSDGGNLQTENRKEPNYITAKSSNGVPLKIAFDSNGHQRPLYQALTVWVSHGYLREGDRIEIVLGDTSGGSPGLRLQTMCESAYAFRVLADVCATNHYVPVALSPTITIVPGDPSVWKAVLPTLRRPGEPFRLGIKSEDRYGNPSDKIKTTVTLVSRGAVSGLPNQVTFSRGQRAIVLENLASDREQTIEIDVLDSQGKLLVRTNPLVVRNGIEASYWADMHAQSGESVGINTAREYFDFARNLAFLDATSHQANDFQINGAFWAHVNELTAEFHEDGRFLTLPGYEWSGNTGVGGDRNVFFRTEGRTIHRSSHALIENREEIHTDSPTARDLFKDLKDEDCFIYAHIGGRPADVSYAHDAKLETAMEIHSVWGTFEWLMEDCFRNGYRVGVVANSDDHKGRPGASYPGASGFGAYGGLTCFLMDRLDRDALFDCVRKRHHYATTGDRIHIDKSILSESGFDRFLMDPNVHKSATEPASMLRMGDIAKAKSATVRISFSVHASRAVERVDVLNGMTSVATVRNPAKVQGSNRIRVLWRGAMTKGRGSRAMWKGKATFEGSRILRAVEINGWNPDRRLEQTGEEVLTWETGTAGNFSAFDVWLEEGKDSRLRIETNFANAEIPLSMIGSQDTVIPAGGMDLEIRIYRLPDELDRNPLSAEIDVELMSDRDNPLWIRVTTEDGFQAWTSPTYLVNDK